MIKIRELRKTYGRFPVLKGLNMHIEKGDVYGFIGKNGCGKTTTMNIICDVIPKDSGEITIEKNPDTGKMARIGYLTETPALFGYMNSYEYLKYIAACSMYEGDVNKRIDEVLDIVNMKSGANRLIKGYSRGMNQRIGIAATILPNPDIIILDEPTSALDPQGRAEVIAIIKNLVDTGATILLCTHILSDIERVANKVGIISGGVMHVEGKIDDVVNSFADSQALLIKLSVYNQEHINSLSLIDGVKSFDFDEKTGELRLLSDDLNSLTADVINIMNREHIVPEKLITLKPTLEDIYMSIVSGNTKNMNK